MMKEQPQSHLRSMKEEETYCCPLQSSMHSNPLHSIYWREKERNRRAPPPSLSKYLQQRLHLLEHFLEQNLSRASSWTSLQGGLVTPLAWA